MRAGHDATLLIAEWGPDIPRAKALVEELGISQFVRWFSPAPERRLAQMLAAADLVLDQFGTFGTFGLIAPKAMACGTPCLLSFDPGIHSWCFDEIPPLIAAGEDAEIFQAMQRHLTDPAELALCGSRSRQWVIDHHGKSIVARKLERVAEAALNSGPLASFAELRAERQKSTRPPTQFPSRLEILLSTAGQKIKKGKRVVPVLKEIITGLRNVRTSNQRIAQIEQAMHDDVRWLEQVVQSELKRVDQSVRSDLQRLELELLSRSALSHQEVVKAFELMGQNRLDDHTVITKIRGELLETIVRTRLALPPRSNPSSGPPLMGEVPSLSDACLKLQQAAPLNWKKYGECVDRGTASYKSFPPGSCSTQSHPQAELFRAFLKPYLRGQVLDVGCGPQPVHGTYTAIHFRKYPVLIRFQRRVTTLSLSCQGTASFCRGRTNNLTWSCQALRSITTIFWMPD